MSDRLCRCLIIWLFFLALAATGGQFQIIATGDIHGNRESFSRLAPLIRAYPRALKIDLGDLFHGDPLCDVMNGAPMISALNSLNYDLYIPGNHEFELSLPQYAELCRSFKGTVLGQWNISGFSPCRWKLIERDGFRCAVIGMSDNGIWRNRRFYPGVKIIEELTAVKSALADIKKHNADLVVFARHGGNYLSSMPLGRFLHRCPEIDVVICGHSHKEIAGQRSGRVLIVQPGANAASAVLLTVRRSENKTLHIESRLLRPQAEADAELAAIFSKALHSRQAALNKLVLNVASQNSFADTLLKNIRQTMKSDCAAIDLPELLPGNYTLEHFLKIFPYRNCMAVITVSRTEYLKFIREKAPAGRRRFASAAPADKEKFTLAVNLFQLQRSSVLRFRKDFRMIDMIERDIILRGQKL